MSILCPSSPCKEGAILLGIVLADGSVAYASNHIVVDADFVQNATRQGSHPPETRFRFSSPCVQGACRQWTGSRCGVIDEVTTTTREVGYDPDQTSLPDCSIRPDCRWFRQSGAEACAVCNIVVTDTRSGVISAADSPATNALDNGDPAPSGPADINAPRSQPGPASFAQAGS